MADALSHWTGASSTTRTASIVRNAATDFAIAVKPNNYHSVLCATMVGIGHRHTVALRPKFMSPQDGDKKQDCEPKAAYRWFEKNARRYASLRPIYLGDDLYAKQPMCERVIDAGADFVFRVKTDDHKTLFDYLAGID